MRFAQHIPNHCGHLEPAGSRRPLASLLRSAREEGRLACESVRSQATRQLNNTGQLLYTTNHINLSHALQRWFYLFIITNWQLNRIVCFIKMQNMSKTKNKKIMLWLTVINSKEVFFSSSSYKTPYKCVFFL